MKERHHALEITLAFRANRQCALRRDRRRPSCRGHEYREGDALSRNYAGRCAGNLPLVDLHRTLELNRASAHRFQQSIADVGKRQGNRWNRAARPLGRCDGENSQKSLYATSIRYDDNSFRPIHLMEVVTQDRPGLYLKWVFRAGPPGLQH